MEENPTLQQPLPAQPPPAPLIQTYPNNQQMPTNNSKKILNKKSGIIIIILVLSILVAVITGVLLFKKNLIKVNTSEQARPQPSQGLSQTANESLKLNPVSVKILDATNSTRIKASFKAKPQTRDEIENKIIEKFAQDEAFLYLQTEPRYYSYWAKNFRVPIDLIWINGEDILDLKENIPPVQSKEIDDSYIPRYFPNERVNKGLILNAGAIDKYSINTGDKLVIER